MGTKISYAVYSIFYVSIVLLHILIINSKAEIPTAYFKRRKNTWKEARNSCKLIGLFEKIQVSNNMNGQYGWVDASVEYTPWVEYKKCYHVKQEDIAITTVVRYGNQLQDCLISCQAYAYIGLKQDSCVCLDMNETDIIRARSMCKQNETEQCKKDKFLYCANANISPYGFIIYKKDGTIIKQDSPGNCLRVFSVDGKRNYFQPTECQTAFKSLCKTDSEPGISQVLKSDWMNSTKQCSPHLPFSYTGYKQLNRIDRGNFWLADIRRPIIRKVVDLNQTYCIAVSIENTNKVTWLVRLCTEKLSALCDDTDITSPQEQTSTIAATTPYETLSTTTDNISTGSEKKENRTNEILLIALIITAVLALSVIIAVIIFYKRRTSLRSRHLPLVVPINEVTYAQVNKPTKEKAPDHAGEPTRNNPADDTYDHMEHHRLSQNQIPTESNYDTMQSVGIEKLENDYDVTSGTDRPRQIVVDDTAEYSHVQVEHHEIKDVST